MQKSQVPIYIKSQGDGGTPELKWPGWSKELFFFLGGGGGFFRWEIWQVFVMV